MALLTRQAQDETSGLAGAIKGLGFIIGAVGKFALMILDAVSTAFKMLGNIIAGIGAAISFAITGKFKEAGTVIKETFKDLAAQGNNFLDRVAALYLNATRGFNATAGALKSVNNEFREANKYAREYGEETDKATSNILKGLKQVLARAQELKGFLLQAKAQVLDVGVAIETVLGELDEGIKQGMERLQERLRVTAMLIERAKGITMQFAEQLVNAFEGAIRGTQSLGEALKQLLEQMALMIVRAAIMAAITKAIFAATGIGAESFGELFAGFLTMREGGMVQGFRPIATFQEGGIVTRPTLAVVGEGGEPEVILPISKLQSLQPQIYITVHNATPSTYVEVFTAMGAKEKKIIKKEILNA
jgi:hypothetical protein